MNLYVTLYWVYFCLAAFSCGCMGFAGVLNAVAIKKFKLGLNSIACYRVFLAMGYSLTTGTLLWLTLPQRSLGIHPNTEYWFYTIGLLAASIGSLGLAFKNINVYVKLEYKKYEQNGHQPKGG